MDGAGLNSVRAEEVGPTRLPNGEFFFSQSNAD
jgi:hypothetical protein